MGNNGVKYFSEEHKRKISISHMGSKNPMWGKHHSLEHKKKVGDALRGIPKSAEMKRKMGLAHKGKIVSQATRDKIRLSVAKNGRRVVSKSATAFLDKIEIIYAIKLQREFRIGCRSFDSKYGQVLLEIDGIRWHTNNPVDILKENLAREHGFVVERFIVNHLSEVERRFQEYRTRLDRIFL